VGGVKTSAVGVTLLLKPPSGAAASGKQPEYAAPLGLEMILVFGAAKMPRLRRSEMTSMHPRRFEMNIDHESLDIATPQNRSEFLNGA